MRMGDYLGKSWTGFFAFGLVLQDYKELCSQIEKPKVFNSVRALIPSVGKTVLILKITDLIQSLGLVK